MSIDDRSRHDLHTALEGVLGPHAHTLMGLLPPSGWSDLATTKDLDRHAAINQRQSAELRADLRTDMADLRVEVKADLAEVRAEMAEVRGEIAEVRREFVDFRGDVRTDLASMRVEMATNSAAIRSHVSAELSANLRTLALVNAGTLLTGVGLAFTAARFG